MLYFPNAITFSITSSISVARYDLAKIAPAMQYSTVFIDFCELKGYSLNSLLYSTVNISLRYKFYICRKMGSKRIKNAWFVCRNLLKGLENEGKERISALFYSLYTT